MKLTRRNILFSLLTSPIAAALGVKVSIPKPVIFSSIVDKQTLENMGGSGIWWYTGKRYSRYRYNVDGSQTLQHSEDKIDWQDMSEPNTIPWGEDD